MAGIYIVIGVNVTATSIVSFGPGRDPTASSLIQRPLPRGSRGDVGAIVDLLREDVRMTHLPDAVTWDGREEVARELRRGRAA